MTDHDGEPEEVAGIRKELDGYHLAGTKDHETVGIRLRDWRALLDAYDAGRALYDRAEQALAEERGNREAAEAEVVQAHELIGGGILTSAGKTTLPESLRLLLDGWKHGAMLIRRDIETLTAERDRLRGERAKREKAEARIQELEEELRGQLSRGRHHE